MNALFSYIDYREFLRDYYAEQKSLTRYFSYRYFSQQAGINSPNFLKQVIESKRNLTKLTIARFITALRLSEKEACFFRHLVLFNQAIGVEEKKEHYTVMLSMMHTIKELRLTADQHEYYNYWFVPVIRELICIRDFKNDFKKLASFVSPSISAREVHFAVNLLLRLNLIEKLVDGTYKQVSTAILSNSDVAQMAVRSFNREMLHKAEAALDDVPRNERNIFGMTIGVSKACYDVLVAEMNAFRDRVVTITNSDQQSSRVYQMNLQFFPLSKDVRDDAERGEVS